MTIVLGLTAIAYDDGSVDGTMEPQGLTHRDVGTVRFLAFMDGGVLTNPDGTPVTAGQISGMTAAMAAKMAADPGGTIAQYVRGNGTLATFPAIPAAPSQASATRSLNTAFQVSTTRDAWVNYSVQLTVTASIAGGQNGDVILEMADNSGFSAGVQTLAIQGLGQTYTLAIALQGVQPQTGLLQGFVPAGKWVRLRTVNNTGTPAFSYRAGQEVLV